MVLTVAAGHCSEPNSSLSLASLKPLKAGVVRSVAIRKDGACSGSEPGSHLHTRKHLGAAPSLVLRVAHAWGPCLEDHVVPGTKPGVSAHFAISMVPL